MNRGKVVCPSVYTTVFRAKGQGVNLQCGASFAAWSPDGHELLYQVGDQIMATIFELANNYQESD